MTNHSEKTSQETAKAMSYKLLAECYHLPDDQLAENLQALEESMRIHCREAVGRVTEMKNSLNTIRHMDELKRDFARLFVGPYRLFASPYGSVYLDGARQVMGPSTLDAIDRYRQGGLALAEDFYDAPDHIAVELEFLHFLTVREVQALIEDDCQGTREFQAMRDGFLRKHLGAWVAEFSGEVEENADTSFYRSLARCTRLFIEREMNELEC